MNYFKSQWMGGVQRQGCTKRVQHITDLNVHMCMCTCRYENVTAWQITTDAITAAVGVYAVGFCLRLKGLEAVISICLCLKLKTDCGGKKKKKRRFAQTWSYLYLRCLTSLDNFPICLLHLQARSVLTNGRLYYEWNCLTTRGKIHAVRAAKYNTGLELHCC